MSKFIYVFSPDARDAFLNKGFSLIKSDDRQNIFVFESKSELEFNLPEVSFIYSDTLTF